MQNSLQMFYLTVAIAKKKIPLLSVTGLRKSSNKNVTKKFNIV